MSLFIFVVMKSFVFLLLLSASVQLAAAPVAISVPGQNWAVSFDSPVALKLDEKSNLPGSYFSGSSPRFNISLFVGVPSCPGGTTAYDSYKCLRGKIYTIPGVVDSSISLERRGSAVQVMYIVYVPVGDRRIKTMHTHVLFERNGQWGDLHMSSVQPTVEEVARLIELGGGFSVEEKSQ